MRFCSFFLLIFMALAAYGQETNLIKNPGLEDGDAYISENIVDHWRSRGERDTMPYQRIVDTEPHGGKRCGLLDLPDGTGPDTIAWIGVKEGIQVKSGKTYRFSFWGRPLTGHGEVILQLYDKNNSIAMEREIRCWADPNVTTWRPYSLEILTPSGNGGSYLMRISFRMVGAGRFYFDDVELAETNPLRYRTNFYPGSVTHRKEYPMIRDDVAYLMIYPFTTEAPEGHELQLDMPEQLDLLEVNAVYANKTPVTFTKKVENGRRLCTIQMNPETIRPMPMFVGQRILGTGLLLYAGKELQKSELKWKLVKKGELCDGGTISVSGIDHFRGRLPKHFSFTSWYSPMLSYVQDKELLKRCLDSEMASGFNAGSLERRQDQEFFNARGYQNLRSFSIGRVADYCMTRAINGDAVFRYVRQSLSEIKGFENAALDWNFEPELVEYYHMCPDCRKAFETHSGKSAKGMKDGYDMEKAYPKEYFAFRSSQHYTLMKKFADLCHEAGVKAALCPFRHTDSEENNLRKAKSVGDQQAYFALMDFVVPMIFAVPEKLWDQLEVQLAYWPNCYPDVTNDEITNGSSPGYAMFTPESVYLRIMIIAMQKCKKMLFFHGYHAFDGSQIDAARRAMDEVAQFEDYLYSDEKADQRMFRIHSKYHAVRSRLYKKNGSYLLGIINPDAYKEGFVEFTLQTELKDYVLFDAKNNTVITDKDGNCTWKADSVVVLPLKAGEVKFLLIGNSAAPYMTMKKEPAGKLPEYAQEKTIFTGKSWICTQKFGDITVKGNRFNGRILTSDGGVLAVKGAYIPVQGEGGFFRDLLSYPTSANWGQDCRAEYVINKIEEKDNQLVLVLSHRFQQTDVDGLTLQKIYRIAESGRVTMEIELTNTGSKPLEIAYWNHNRVDLPRKDVQFTIGKGTIVKPADISEGEGYYPAAAPLRMAEKQVGSVECQAGDIDKMYTWYGAYGPTMEFMGKKQTLTAGKSISYTFFYTPAE